MERLLSSTTAREIAHVTIAACYVMMTSAAVLMLCVVSLTEYDSVLVTIVTFHIIVYTQAVRKFTIVVIN